MDGLQVIGLTGYKGHGKTTVAKILEKDHGYYRVSFGTALKEMISRIDPLLSHGADGEPIYYSDAITMVKDEIELKKAFPEYRRFMQKLGTEGIRAVDDDFWIKMVGRLMTWLDTNQGINKIVVEDVRFPNEASFVRGHKNNKLIQIHNPHVQVDTSHESESWVGKMGEDQVLANRGSLDYLRSLVQGIAQ